MTSPLVVGAAAVYPYSDELLATCARVSKFDEAYNLARVVGAKGHQRLWLPRTMVPNWSGVEDHRVDGTDYGFVSKFIPRNDEQGRVIKEAVAMLEKGRNFVVECPTGFGKTWVSTDIIAKVGKKTLIVVTKEDIRDQWIAAFKACLGLDVGNGIGLIQADTVLVAGQGVVIAMVQSIAKEARYAEHFFSDFGLAIFDEVHRIAADYFSQACFRVPARLRMGLSATPDRKDGKWEVVKAHIGPVLVRTTTSTMTPRILWQMSPWEIPYHRKLVGKHYELVPIAHTAGKCGHIINMLVHHHGRNALLANFIAAAHKKGRTVLIQSDRVDHLHELSELTKKRGVPGSDIGFYERGLTSSQREVIKKKRVIFATYQMTAEATDIPQLDTLVMATPKSDVRQIVGRILREHPGKNDPLVFDLVDASSAVFSGYFGARRKWYDLEGAIVEQVGA